MGMRDLLSNISAGGSVINEYGERTMNEAFYGAKKVDRIEKCMVILANAIDSDPHLNLDKHPANIELQKATCEIFGFKRTVVVWSNLNANSMDICQAFTIPQNRIAHSADVGSGGDPYVKNRNLVFAVCMSATMVTELGVTPKELTAIYLHEMGHNFDFTYWALLRDWVTLISLTGSTVGNYFAVEIVKEVSPEGFVRFLNQTRIIDTATKLIPPLGVAYRGIGKVSKEVSKVFMGIFHMCLVPSMILTVPAGFLMAPIMSILNVYTQRSEVYADEFAASFGYGPYLISALDKMNASDVYDKDSNSAISEVMKDIAVANAEYIAVITSGHGSTQQRSYRVLDKLDKDIRDPNIPPALRNELMEARVQMAEAHEELWRMSDEERTFFRYTASVLIDQWVADGRIEKDLPRLFDKGRGPQYVRPLDITDASEGRSALDKYLHTINSR